MIIRLGLRKPKREYKVFEYKFEETDYGRAKYRMAIE